MLLNNITEYLRELGKRIDVNIPTSLKIQIGPQQNFQEKTVKNILLTQSITKESILHAKKLKSNFIICINGLPSGSIDRIDQFSQNHILFLLQSHIMVGVLPHSWVNFPKGPVDLLKRILVVENEKRLSNLSGVTLILKKNAEISLKNLIDILHRNLNMDFLQVRIGAKNVQNIFFKYPEYVTMEDVKNAKYEGCECIICSGISLEAISSVEFFNIGVVQIPVFILAESALKRFCSALAIQFPRTEFEFFPSDPIIYTSERKSLRQ